MQSWYTSMSNYDMFTNPRNSMNSSWYNTSMSNCDSLSNPMNSMNSSWYKSMSNYHTLSTNPEDSMNLLMNRQVEHQRAWAPMFNVPTYSFGNYMPYTTSASNNFLIDPRHTVAQSTWGTPAWNKDMWNQGGWTPWGGTSPWGNNTGSSTTSTDPEAIKHREKYNKLLSLVKQLKNYEYLSNDDKRNLEAAINDTKGTDQEKYERLSKAYKAIGIDKVREFLVDGANNVAVISPTSDAGKNTAKNNFYYQLTSTGFEYKGKEMDNSVEDFFNSIDNELKSNQGTTTKAADVVQALNEDNILDFISSYNSNYRNKSGATRIFDHISANWSDVSDELKPTVHTNIITPLVDKLIEKAQTVRNSLDDVSQDAIRDAIAELETAKSNSKTSIDSNLSSAFDKLYLLTRKGALAKVTNDAVAYYSEIDSDLFKADMFNQKIKEDLLEEGFDDSAIDAATVNISGKEARRASGKADEPETPEEKAAREAKEAEYKANQQVQLEQKQKDIKAFGASLADDLSGSTDDSFYSTVDTNLATLDKDNIMHFLTGYYIDGNNLGNTEGLIEKLDDESGADGVITMANKRKIVDSLMKVAEAEGLSSSPNYVKLKSVLAMYDNSTNEGQERYGAKDFNYGGGTRALNSEGLGYTVGNGLVGMTVGGSGAAVGAAACAASGPVGWIIGGLAIVGGIVGACCDQVTDNEVIDEHMEALFQEIRAKQASQGA